jgi:flagellar M-ring protein FliF
MGQDRALAAPISPPSASPPPEEPDADMGALSVHETNQMMLGPMAAGQIRTALPAPGQEAATLDPVDRLRRLIEEREEETIEILRSWMEEDDGVRP